VGPAVSASLLGFDMPGFNTSIDTAPEAAIFVLIFVYFIAGMFNLNIPRTKAVLIPFPAKIWDLVQDFRQCNKRLWNDKLGQISLSATTIFWGAGGNLRYIVLAWAGVALGYTTTQASSLTGVVAIGTAAGAVWASTRTRLEDAPSVMPLGIGIGLVVILMNFITNLWIAVPFLIALGAFGGYLVVPMNALLQHRGASLMGAGRSIAVQNFNEQACILFLGFFYAAMTSIGVGAFGAITAFGLVVAGAMYLVKRWHASNLKNYPDEVNRLLDIAKKETH
jgi:MFS transporter, LPLT family, lysophospholipid transporter